MNHGSHIIQAPNNRVYSIFNLIINVNPFFTPILSIVKYFLTKVAWVKVANMDILSIVDYKVTNDDRIRLLHGYVSDWSLSIQPVNEEDAGEYICQINTEPQIITKINVEVLCKCLSRTKN